jgi:hypothetical protein
VRRIREAIGKDGLSALRQARLAATRMWPALDARGRGAELGAEAEELGARLDSPDFFEQLPEITKLSRKISQTYRSLYRELHDERRESFNRAIDEIKGRAEWLLLAEEMQASILAPLVARACDESDLPDGAAECPKCKASIGEMESDLAALPALKDQAVVRLRVLTKPPEEETLVVKVRLAEFFAEPLDSEAAVNEAVERLREHLLRLLAEKAPFIVE